MEKEKESGLLDEASEGMLSKGMEPDMFLRIIGGPNFGAIGQLVSLPTELTKIETESYIRVRRGIRRWKNGN